MNIFTAEDSCSVRGPGLCWSRDVKPKRVVRYPAGQSRAAGFFPRRIFAHFVHSAVKWLTGWLFQSSHCDAIPQVNRCHYWENVVDTEPTFSVIWFQPWLLVTAPGERREQSFPFVGMHFEFLGISIIFPLSQSRRNFTCGVHQVLTSFVDAQYIWFL